MVKVGLKGRHTLTGVSRSGVLTGAASRKAATKKLMGGQAAVGRIRRAAARRVPFTGVSKTSAGIRRVARAPVSTAARAAAGMWVHDKFEEQVEAEEDEDEEWAVDSSSSRSTWSGDHGVQIIDHGTVSAATRAPKVVIHRGMSAPASFKITLAGGRQHLAKSGGARGSTPSVTLAPAPSTTAANRRDVEGVWRHDLFNTRSQGRAGGRRAGASGGRGGRTARKRSVRPGAAAEVSSRPLAERLDMALGS